MGMQKATASVQSSFQSLLGNKTELVDTASLESNASIAGEQLVVNGAHKQFETPLVLPTSPRLAHSILSPRSSCSPKRPATRPLPRHQVQQDEEYSAARNVPNGRKKVFVAMSKSHNASRTHTHGDERISIGGVVPVLQDREKNPEHNLLGELMKDKLFLMDLRNDTSVCCKDVTTLYDCTEDVDSALKYLDQRTEFWRQRQPFLYKPSQLTNQKGYTRPQSARRARASNRSSTPTNFHPTIRIEESSNGSSDPQGSNILPERPSSAIGTGEERKSSQPTSSKRIRPSTARSRSKTHANDSTSQNNTPRVQSRASSSFYHRPSSRASTKAESKTNNSEEKQRSFGKTSSGKPPSSFEGIRISPFSILQPTLRKHEESQMNTSTASESKEAKRFQMAWKKIEALDARIFREGFDEWDAVYEDAKALLSKYRYARVQNRSVVTSTLHNRIGIIEMSRSRFTAALVQFGKDLEISLQFDLNAGYQRAIAHLGACYRQLNRCGDALKMWKKLLVNYMKMNNRGHKYLRVEIASVHASIAEVYHHTKSSDLALEHSYLAINILNSGRSEKGEDLVISDVCSSDEDQDDDPAVVSTNQVSRQERIRMDCNLIIGGALHQKGSHEEAQSFINSAKAIAIRVGDESALNACGLFS